MISVFLIVSLVINIFFIFLLLRYRLAIKDISQQIHEKYQTVSHTRLKSIHHTKSLIELIGEVDTVFQEMERIRFLSQREKKTLDMAISNITHDIRTPLTIASGYTQQLLKKDEKNAPTLVKVATNLIIVSKRLESLLEYRRLMEEAIHPKKREISISTVIRKQLIDYYDTFKTAGFHVDIDIEEGLVLNTDPDIIERIIQNILSNILKHGKVEAKFYLRRENDAIMISAKNIVQQPIHDLEGLTNRFYSENLSKSEESSGLGLYITQQLVLLLKGELTMKAEADWFEVTIQL